MKRKRIFIDGLGLVDGHFSGVGQYILGILRGLDETIELKKYLGEQTPEIRVIIPRDKVKHFNKFGFRHIGYKKFPLPFRYMAALWHRGKLPPLDLWCGKGKYIFPRFVDMPLLFSKSAALVVFDLSFELHREYSDEKNANFLSKEVRKSIQRTNKVIAISDHARQELIDFYKLKPADVVVATPATDPERFYRRSKSEIDGVKKKYGIKGDYILALSNLEPRKNLNALVDAYCNLPEKYRKNTALLLVGVSGWKTDELFNKIITRVEEGYNIIRPNKYVSDKDKPAVISGAKLLAYPSHYEGFGMPPVEALACGVPVISANNSSLPQAVGNTAILIDIEKEGLLDEALVETLDNLDDITKRTLTDGPKQAQAFSWVKSAQIFLDAIEESP